MHRTVDWRDTVNDRAEARAYEVRLDQEVASDIAQYTRAAERAAAIDSAAVEVLRVYRARTPRRERARSS
jgi:hypothetical protein